MRASVRANHCRTFRTDIERLTDGHLRWTPLDMLRATNTQAEFRGAVPKGPHTSSDASLERYLEDRFATDGIHLDLSVSIQR